MAELPLRAFRFLLSLAEMDPPWAAHGVVEEETGLDATVLAAAGLLVPGRNAEAIQAGPEDCDLRPVLDADDAAGTLRCFHPDVGFVDVAADSLRTWRLDAGRLATLLGRRLGLPASFQATTLVDDLLWDLGTPRLGRAGTPVLFVRRLADEKSRCRIRDELRLRHGGKPALLLTSGRHVAADLILPTVSKIVPLMDAVDRASTVARLDTNRLGRIVGGQPTAVAHPELPVDCEEDGHWLRIHDKTYQFRGTQARIIRHLYEGWARGEPWLRVQDVLEQAESGSSQIKEAFRGKREWQEVIEVKAGSCRLRIDAADP